MSNSVEPGFKHDHSYHRARSAGLQRLGISADDAVHAGVMPAVVALGDAVSPLHSVMSRLEAVRKVGTWLDKQFEIAAAPDSVSDIGEVLPPNSALHVAAQRIQNSVAHLLHNELLPLLEAHGIQTLHPEDLDGTARAALLGYFQSRIYPLLTPLAVDPGHPFPYISTNSLNLLVEVRRPYGTSYPDGGRAYARVKLPRACPLVIPVPGHGSQQRYGDYARYGTAIPVGVRRFVWTSALVNHCIHELFPGIDIESVYLFRLLRKVEPDVAMGSNRYGVNARNRPVARLDVQEGMPSVVVDWLSRHLQVDPLRVLRASYLGAVASLPELIVRVGTSAHTTVSSGEQFQGDTVRTSVAA